MENQITQKWFQKPITVILFLIFFFPVGLYLMWKNELWSKTVRVVVSVFFGLLVLLSVKDFLDVSQNGFLLTFVKYSNKLSIQYTIEDFIANLLELMVDLSILFESHEILS